MPQTGKPISAANGLSSPYCENMWRRYCCLAIFPIVETCLSCEDIAKQICAMVHRWCGPSANLECRSEMCCMQLAGNTGRKKLPFWYHRTTLLGYSFRIKACFNNWKKNLLNLITTSACPGNMVNFGLRMAEICWWVWGTPTNFNGFCVWAVLLHGTLVVGVSQTLRHWTEGATYIRQGGHQVGHWPIFLVPSASIVVQFLI